MPSQFHLHICKICSCYAGVTGGAGLIMIITIAIVIVSCVIMKRRITTKPTLTGEWCKLVVTVFNICGSPR